jgi:ornithine cyclodeaminase/alanine dehydrogenase-like protein (mu-crystallin family)
VLVLSASDVEALLDLDLLVDRIEQAMVDLSAGRVSMPARVAAQVADRHAMLAAMPAYLPTTNALMTKLVSLFPDNRDRPTHQALICCFDPDTGTPLALMDGTYVTATRTAAGSALATRILARADAGVVAVIGTGVQARSHARALSRLPRVTAIRLAGRDHARAVTLAETLGDSGVTVEPVASIEDAVRSADVVCAATHPDQPVVRREWLATGTHVNSVGYNTSGSGELDTATLRDALVVVESRAAVLAPPPSGAVEIHRAIDEGALTAEALVEIGEVCAGTHGGRTGADQLTVYKSVGIAVQDAAAAALVLAAAYAAGAGVDVAIT